MEPWNTTKRPFSALSNCTLDTSYRFTFYQISYGAIFIVGLATNGLALHRLWHSPRTLTSTMVYMASLSVADMCFVASLPLRIYFYHQRGRAFSALPADRAAWLPGGVFCQLTFTVKYISLYGGIFFLVCIALDRYLAVVHPAQSPLRRLRFARLLSAAIWCLVLGISVGLPLLRYAGMASLLHHPCLLDPTSRRQRPLILSALGLVLGAFLLPTALLLFSYCRVLSVLGRPRHRCRAHAAHTLTVIYWVLAVFLLCFAPYHANLLVYTLGHVGLLPMCGLARASMALHPVVLSLASANCCLNPLIYYFSSSLVHREPASGGSSGSQGDALPPLGGVHRGTAVGLGTMMCEGGGNGVTLITAGDVQSVVECI